MSKDVKYEGWQLFDKVTIIAKPRKAYDFEKHCSYLTGTYQGYVADPNNKSQLESARRWGTWQDSVYIKDEKGEDKFDGYETHTSEEFTYDNCNFQLTLVDCAEQSSQGGKLSFWNCNIKTPDGRVFLIGIAANLLLDVLKNCTVNNGTVAEPLRFARCKGGVGMLADHMDAYKQAISDMERKKTMSKGKTSKHKVGYSYETTTDKSVYMGDIYRWYEPVKEQKSSGWIYGTNEVIVGFRKLDKPIKLMWFPRVDSGHESDMDYYLNHCYTYQFRDKLPARREGEKLFDLDGNLDFAISKLEKSIFDAAKAKDDAKRKGLTCSSWVDERCVGLSSNKDEYEMSPELKKAIQTCGYRVE